MHELLLDNNYKCFKSDEVWLQPGSDKPYEFAVLDKDEILIYKEIFASSKSEATNKLKAENYILLNDLSNKKRIESIVNLLNVFQNS